MDQFDYKLISHETNEQTSVVRRHSMSRALLEKILAELPAFHCGDTETAQTFAKRRSSLRVLLVDNIKKKVPARYGVDPELARFLFDSVSEQSRFRDLHVGLCSAPDQAHRDHAERR
jgi:hypothetical protein